MTIPNILSIIRFILVPVFGYAYLGLNNSIAAAAILLISGFTDVLDGYIARKYNMQSYLGMILDPAADKITQAVVGICALIKYPQILFLVIIFFIKEILAAAAACYLASKHKKIRGSLIYGKAATFGFYLVMGLLVILPSVSDTVVYILAAACAALLIIAFLSYIKLYFEILKED